MLTFTTNQWAILFLVLVLGWLLGLLSRSGGARWRREAAAERDARIAAERDRDARLAAVERDRDTRLAAADARIAELERTRAQPATPVSTTTVTPIGTSAAAPVTTDRVVISPTRGDDLTLIHGIDPRRASRLNEEGINSFRDITALSGDQEWALEDRLGITRGTVAREEWRAQADLLDRGRTDEHRARWRS